MDMGALLDLEDAQSGGQLRRGEIIEGMVMGASPDGLIVDVGTKTEAVIPQNEMLSLGLDGASKLKAGDTVRVMVLQPSSAEGHAIVSLDRARGEEGWETLQKRFESGEIFEAQVTGHNRGGLLVNVEGVNAFVPLSQVESVRRDDPDAVNQLAGLVGQVLKLKVVELNRKRNRVILSERAAMAEVRKEMKDRVLEELQEGQIRTGRVSSITDFGVFVDLGGADGLAHMTELTWERGKKAKDLFQVGDEVQAYILKIDRENKKISLSLKRAQPERWDSTVDRLVIGQILIGRVTKLMPFGAFVRLEGPVEGLIHISELSNRRIQHPKDVVKEGDVVPVKLVRIEKDRHRLGLSLRQARNDAEAMGFVFDANGSVIDYPDDVREQFGLPPRDTSAQPARREPRTAQEAIERAVARDPEPMSAFAAAFAQALENAEAGNGLAETVAQVAGVAPAHQPGDDTTAPAAEAEAESPEATAAAEAAPAEEAAPAAQAESPAEAVAEPSGNAEDEIRVSTGATNAPEMPDNTNEGSAAPESTTAAPEEETADGS
ncbi:30S ribosomal protein S1 [Tepidiforma sp.]|uniref:30S ribosomal protein S1 n=1 Tax=Tepidiforma sp. TaxID=2682230 RepID=UPI002ADD4A43|nr:S1 RNA-binding domain-containing protein [Tepidiforma sp.]